eukprot:15474713-Alexandrium_andersonii.AAC.1
MPKACAGKGRSSSERAPSDLSDSAKTTGYLIQLYNQLTRNLKLCGGCLDRAVQMQVAVRMPFGRTVTSEC